MNIYVGNLPYNTSEDDIRDLFSEHGEVQSVKLITDRETGRLKGFGFVEMSQNSALQAIENLNEFEFNDRQLVVNEARQREDRPRGGGGGGRSNYNRNRY